MTTWRKRSAIGAPMLARLARALNAQQVRYVLIGGFAVIAHGGARITKDIDILVDADPANIARDRAAVTVRLGDVPDESRSR